MKNKIVLMTGVTGSIGKATALEIAKYGVKLILLARNKRALEDIKNEISIKSGNKEIELLVADLSDISSIKNVVKEFKEKFNRLDVLLNVAAVYTRNRKLSKDNLEMMFATNHLAPFILTKELIHLLKRNQAGRIVTVSAPSTTKLNFSDLQGEKKFSSLNAFGASKMMNLLFTYKLARELEGTNVSACVYHPGLVKSKLTHGMPIFLRFLLNLISKSPDKAAPVLAKLAVDDKYENSNGKFYKYTGKELKSSPYSYDIEVQNKLWAVTEEILKEK